MKIIYPAVFVMIFTLTIPAYSAIFTYVDDQGKKWYVNDINQVPDRYHSQIGKKYKESSAAVPASSSPKKGESRKAVKVGGNKKKSSSSGGIPHKRKKKSKKSKRGS